MASATGTRAAAAAEAALLFSFSGIVLLLLLLLLQAPRPGLAADLLVSALDRFLDGRGLLELATRRNMMILLGHAILLLILRDAGVLGAPAACRRSRSPPAVAAGVTDAVVAQTAAPARRHATRSAAVWRNRADVVVAPVHEHDAAGRVVNVECRPAVDAAVATWAAPALLTTGPPPRPPPPQAEEAAAAVATKQMVVVESPRNDDHRRAAVVEPPAHPTATAADGETDDCDARRIIAVVVDDDKRVDDTAREHQTALMEMEMEMELADDKTFEEFIKSQRRKMLQESLQLVRSGYHYQATATCY